LNQSLSNRYAYHFKAMMTSSVYASNQRRFGFHFFCDSASKSNRGNSYFIFFRQESSQLEFYKVTNNAYQQTKIVTGVTTNFGQWYDYKVLFDRITGKIDVYRDNVFLGTWTDPTPLTTGGNYISFRTGNAKVYFDSLEVFRSRYPTITVNVGSASTNDIRYQNPNPYTPSGLIRSVCNDSAGNISTIVSQKINVDWTNPICATVNDGTGADEDTTTSLTALSANWNTSSDANSGIIKYWYAIGTTSGAIDVVIWTDNLLSTSVTKAGLSLINGQRYYISIKTMDGAGLTSVCISDGIVASVSTGIADLSEIVDLSLQPNPFNTNTTLYYTLKDEQKIRISLVDMLGKETVIINTIQGAGKHSLDINAEKFCLSRGIYNLKLFSDKKSTSVKFIKL
jgi:hypothetical protein